MSTMDKVERVVAPVVRSSGLELVDVEVQSGTVRITVDRSGGVDLDAIGSATSAISRALDEADAVPGGHYELEVSSPGLERRLRRPEHFQAQIGAMVSIKTKPGTEGDRRLEGVIAAADQKTIRVEGESVAGGGRSLPYGDIERAHTVFDWRAALAGTSAPTARREHKAARRHDGHTDSHERDDDRHETETR
ncbi:MAG: ribosome maturation factor RimP [Acidimicrobiales bacterium]